MNRLFTRISCAILSVGLPGSSVSAQTPSTASSALQLSDARIHEALDRTASANWNQGTRTYGQRVGKGAVKGALIGLIVGFGIGLSVNHYCHQESSSCAEVIPKAAGLGAAYGAAFGAIRAAVP
jgi:hypothetical protein